MEFNRHNHLPRPPINQIQHNHTYHLPVENNGAMQRPISRDKAKPRKSEIEHLTRDEKRARALSVPITVEDIINLPMDEFNERLSKYDLSETQLSLIRDIRRRGKNKVRELHFILLTNILIIYVINSSSNIFIISVIFNISNNKYHVSLYTPESKKWT